MGRTLAFLTDPPRPLLPLRIGAARITAKSRQPLGLARTSLSSQAPYSTETSYFARNLYNKAHRGVVNLAREAKSEKSGDWAQTSAGLDAATIRLWRPPQVMVDVPPLGVPWLEAAQGQSPYTASPYSGM